MLTWIREKFGTVVIGGIIAFIAFVFAFYGVFSPKATRGLHEGAVAGLVNGDAISIGDFNRELNQRIEFFKKLTGGKLSEDQLKGLRIREAVFQELANRKLLVQQAKKQGLLASDEEVRDRIRDMKVFQKDGKFDLSSYKQILEANNHTPSSFERLVREDLSLQQWDSYFQDRVHVSDEEVKQEFLLNQDKRNIKYVLLTSEAAKKHVPILDSEIQKFLNDPTKMNLAKMKFEDFKGTLYKGQTFEQSKTAIVKDILAGEKLEDAQKINQKLAEEIIPLLKADKASDARVNALLKPYGLQVKTTGWIARKSDYLPEIGDAKQLMADAFAAQSPIEAKAGGKPKKYLLAGRILVALVTESQKPDLALFTSKERDDLIDQLTQQKAKALFENWMQKVIAQAKIETNAAIVGKDSD